MLRHLGSGLRWAWVNSPGRHGQVILVGVTYLLWLPILLARPSYWAQMREMRQRAFPHR